MLVCLFWKPEMLYLKEFLAGLFLNTKKKKEEDILIENSRILGGEMTAIESF